LLRCFVGSSVISFNHFRRWETDLERRDGRATGAEAVQEALAILEAGGEGRRARDDVVAQEGGRNRHVGRHLGAELRQEKPVVQGGKRRKERK
jgi:hypothetical protein